VGIAATAGTYTESASLRRIMDMANMEIAGIVSTGSKAATPLSFFPKREAGGEFRKFAAKYQLIIKHSTTVFY
jgi:hypothetical protein